MEERSSQPIIIKKKKKRPEGSHGGAWKVAYADFVTAMMAFFLVMWLLAMVSPQKRAALSQYFENYSILAKEGGTSLIEKPVKEPFLKKPDKSLKAFAKRPSPEGGIGGLSSEDFVNKLKNAIDEKLKSVKNQVLVDIVEGGVRIQIIDAAGNMMFPLGSVDPTEKSKEILRLVAENLSQIPNRIAIEGHTDAAPFKGAQTTNWELSTARASAARRELEHDGIDTSRIARVVGYADQQPFVPEDPRDPRNRRISIIVLQEKHALLD